MSDVAAPIAAENGPAKLYKNLTPAQCEVVSAARKQGIEVVELGLKLALAGFAWKPEETTAAAAERLLGEVVTALKSEL